MICVLLMTALPAQTIQSEQTVIERLETFLKEAVNIRANALKDEYPPTAYQQLFSPWKKGVEAVIEQTLGKEPLERFRKAEGVRAPEGMERLHPATRAIATDAHVATVRLRELINDLKKQKP